MSEPGSEAGSTATATHSRRVSWIIIGLGLGVGLAIAMTLAVCAPGDTFAGLSFGMLGATLAVAAFLTVVVAWVLSRWLRRSSFVRLTTILLNSALALMLVGAVQPIGCVASFLLEGPMVASAQAWCESLVPKIEAFRAEHGEYPRDLEQLELPLDPPDFARHPHVYQSNGKTFSFDIEDGGVFTGRSWRSDAPTWTHYD